MCPSGYSNPKRRGSSVYAVSQTARKNQPPLTGTRYSRPAYAIRATFIPSRGLVCEPKDARVAGSVERRPGDPSAAAAPCVDPAAVDALEDIVHRVAARAWKDRERDSPPPIGGNSRADDDRSGRCSCKHRLFERRAFVAHRASASDGRPSRCCGRLDRRRWPSRIGSLQRQLHEHRSHALTLHAGPHPDRSDVEVRLTHASARHRPLHPDRARQSHPRASQCKPGARPCHASRGPRLARTPPGPP